MTTLTFTAANGTSLASYDAIAAGDVTLLNIQSNKLVATAAFGGGRFWYPNGQGDTQSVEALIDRTGVAGGELTAVHLQSKAGVTGYEMQLRSDGDIDCERNGVFETRLTGGGALSGPTTLRATYVHTTGVVEVFTGGVSRGTFTDPAPLTTGFPGASVFSDATATVPSMDNWTDFTAGGAASALQDAEWHPMEPQTNPLTVSVW